MCAPLPPLEIFIPRRRHNLCTATAMAILFLFYYFYIPSNGCSRDEELSVVSALPVLSSSFGVEAAGRNCATGDVYLHSERETQSTDRQQDISIRSPARKIHSIALFGYC